MLKTFDVKMKKKGCFSNLAVNILFLWCLVQCDLLNLFEVLFSLYMLLFLLGRNIVLLLTGPIVLLRYCNSACCLLKFKISYDFLKKYICFQKRNWVFELHLWIIFNSFCCSVSVNTDHNPFPMNYNIISITALASNLCFSALLLLLLRDFVKYFWLFFFKFVHFLGFSFFNL